MTIEQQDLNMQYLQHELLMFRMFFILYNFDQFVRPASQGHWICPKCPCPKALVRNHWPKMDPNKAI